MHEYQSVMRLADVPLDAPIPLDEALYVWDEAGGYWCRPIDWLFRSLHRAAEGGEAAAVPAPAAVPPPRRRQE